MKRTRYAVLALLLLISSALLLRASLPQVATGTWVSGAAMTEARTGAATASLPGGQVLMSGGTTSGGGITNSAEVFDAGSNSWSGLAAVMQDPRSGHTASALADGRVLLAGGENSGGVLGTLEIYDPASQSFSSVGSMLATRKNHGAAVLKGGRVWLVGGSDGTNALASSEIYDPADGSVTSGPNLPQARSGLSATTLLDGTVLIAGGSNDQGDLATTFIYDPTAGTITPGASLSAARSGHTAILLPLNNTVLIAGGSAAGSDLASAELYIPWTGASQATASMGAARNGAAGSGFAQYDGRAMLAGGSGLASSEYYGFATVKTDKDDYAPGEYANVSGSGWQPGETVTVTFHEDLVTPIHPDEVVTTVADAFGNISGVQYLLEEHDLGVRYYLTAVGASSQARTTFTDNTPQVTGVDTGIISPNQASSAGVLDTVTITARNQGAGALTGFEVRIRSGSLIGGTLVRTISIGSLGANTNTTVIWNGKNDASAFVADGTYTARAAATGASENDASAAKATIIVDNTNPTVTLLAPADAATVSGNFKLQATPLDAGGNDSNIDKVEFYVDSILVGTDSAAGGGWDSGNLSAGGFSAGSHTWFARAFDKAGNNADSASRTFNIGVVDATPPVITPNVVGTLGSNGWYTSNVAVSFTVTDGESAISSQSAACTTTTNITSDTTGTTITCSATSAGGTSSSSVTIKRDATPPTAVSGAPNRAADSNGWYNHAVDVVFTGTDATSGIASCTTTNYSGPDAASASVNGSCTDNAGNSSAPVASSTFKYDATAPSVTATPSRAADHDGWYNHSFSVHYSATDTTSGVDACDADDSYSGPDTSSGSVDGSCSDQAGNSASASYSFKYDATAPHDVAVNPDRVADHNGWYNHAFTATWSGLDDTSGIASCTVNNYSGPDTGSGDISGNCTDQAGNASADVHFLFKYDGTAPSVTATPSRAADHNGWYNHSFSVHYSATDTTSGVDACDADDSYSGPDTSSGSVDGSCSDQAGNSASASYSFKYDATAPHDVAVNPDRVADHNGWYNHAFTATWSGLDDTSGIDSCTVNDYSAPDTGSGDISGSCTDNAGNASGAVHFLFKYDATAPVLTLAFTPDSADGNSGWWKTPGGVPFLWSCSDATSGVDAGYNGGCPSPLSGTVTAQGTTNFNHQVRDEAGNLSVLVNRDLMLDNVAPAISLFSRLPAANANGWNNVDVALVWNCSDATSGPVSSSDSKTVSTEGFNQAATGNCEDLAGNTSSHTQSGISIDKTKPTVTLLTPPAGSPYTLNQVVNASFSCNDSLSGFASNNALAASGPNGSDCVGPATANTSTVGSHSYGAGVVATDKADNTSNAVSTTYSVIYNFVGFLQPIDNLPVINSANAGRVIPIKWQLKDANGNLVSDLGSLVSLLAQPMACEVAPSDIVEDTLSSPGATVFRFDGTQFIYNWQTAKNWKGCWLLQASLSDGTKHYAKFSFK